VLSELDFPRLSKFKIRVAFNSRINREIVVERKMKRVEYLVPFLCTVAFMLLVYLFESKFDWQHSFVPELAVLCFGILRYPSGRWATDRIGSILGPTLSALVSTWISIQIGKNPFGVVLSLAATIAILRVLKSVVFPAISAGLFAVLFQINSFSYPLYMFLSCLIVSLVSWFFLRKFRLKSLVVVTSEEPNNSILSPKIAYYLVCNFGIILLSFHFDLPFLIVPPLFVVFLDKIESEDLFDKKILIKELGVLLTSSSIGIILNSSLGLSFISITLSLLTSISILSILRVSVLPIIALGLLPMVVNSSSISYPASVTASFLLITLLSVSFKKSEKSLYNF
jgi:hypothetical protein